MKTRTYQIYTLNDPESGEVRYVGVTSVTLARRLNQHLSESRRKKASHKRHWLRSLIDRELRPTIHLVEVCTEHTWEEREVYWINYHKLTSVLTNTREGGKGVYIGPKDNSSKRIKVYQYSLEGQYLGEYESVTKASAQMGVAINALHSALNGSKASCNGFQWRTYQQEAIERYHKENSTLVQIYKLVPVLEGEYDSVTLAAKTLGISLSAAFKSLNEGKPTKGYLFRTKPITDV